MHAFDGRLSLLVNFGYLIFKAPLFQAPKPLMQSLHVWRHFPVLFNRQSNKSRKAAIKHLSQDVPCNGRAMTKRSCILTPWNPPKACRVSLSVVESCGPTPQNCSSEPARERQKHSSFVTEGSQLGLLSAAFTSEISDTVFFYIIKIILSMSLL